MRTNIPVNGEVQVQIGGKPRSGGRPGISKGSMAVRVTRTPKEKSTRRVKHAWIRTRNRTAADPKPTAPSALEVQSAQFQSLEPPRRGEKDRKMEMLMDLTLPVAIELGRTNMLIRDILDLQRGSVVEFEKLASEPVDILINGKKMAEGEVVVIEKHFGIRITNLVDAAERVRGLGKWPMEWVIAKMVLSLGAVLGLMYALGYVLKRYVVPGEAGEDRCARDRDPRTADASAPAVDLRGAGHGYHCGSGDDGARDADAHRTVGTGGLGEPGGAAGGGPGVGGRRELVGAGSRRRQGVRVPPPEGDGDPGPRVQGQRTGGGQ